MQVKPAGRVYPRTVLISDASGALSTSHHSLAGRITEPEESSATSPCCCPETAIAVTMADEGRLSSERQCESAAIHESGFCSALPVTVDGNRERGQEVRANTELVSTAYASTFSDCVPASTPTATFMIDGFLLESLF